ncbi:MAG: hypothetical protein EZS28_045875, partial [Streblomastix strix]
NEKKLQLVQICSDIQFVGIPPLYLAFFTEWAGVVLEARVGKKFSQACLHFCLKCHGYPQVGNVGAGQQGLATPQILGQQQMYQQFLGLAKNPGYARKSRYSMKKLGTCSKSWIFKSIYPRQALSCSF